MSVSAFSGPTVVFGTASSLESNPDRGPSLFDQGNGIMDPRTPFSYSANGPFYGWLGTTDIPTISQVPSAAAANNIVASQIPVAGTPLTLAAGAGVTSGVSITNAATGGTVTGLLALDGAAGSVAFGQGGNGLGGRVNIWDPTKAISRCVRVVSVGNDSTATFLVSGYDIFGYPMSQLLTGANIGTATTTKAFKYIASVTPAGTLSGSAVTVGTTDVIGLPMRADFFPETDVFFNNLWTTAATGFTPAVTVTATTTTGDVRGTYALQTPSNGTLRLNVYASPSVANISSSAGLVGVTQV